MIISGFIRMFYLDLFLSMGVLRLSYRAMRKVKRMVFTFTDNLFTKFYLKVNDVKFGKALKSNGIPKFDIRINGSLHIGNNFSMNNGNNHNMIGRQQLCYFVVMEGATLVIGDNVGISATAFVCSNHIEIGNNVKIGGNTVIYDTDFHSLDPQLRLNADTDKKNAKNAPIKIGNNVFIGAHATILKGVTIGDKAIIGACSVVTKNIPAGEIWAGNPAKFLKKLG